MNQGVYDQTTQSGITLPPLGQDPQALSGYVDRLVWESELDPRREAWLPEAERNLQLFEGQHWTTPTPAGEIRVILNRTQNAQISLLALQAGEPPKITFNPRESGDPPVTYLNTDLPQSNDIIARFGADPTTGQPMIDPTQPLPQDVADQLKMEFDEMRALAAQASAVGMPSPVQPPPENLLVDVDDSTCSQALQTGFDALWEMTRAQVTYTENILYKNVLGWQPTIVEWDDDKKVYVLTNAHPKHCFPDPVHSDNTTWDYFVYDQLIGVHQALQRFPQVDPQKIIDSSKVGIPRFPGSRSYDQAEMFNMNFQREMVTVRTAWIRCQCFPMTQEEAAAAGQMERRDVPDMTQALQAPPAAVSEAPQDTTEVPDQPPEGQQDGSMPEAPPEQAPPEAPPMRTGYFLPGDNEEASETVPDDESGEGATKPNPKWPMRYGIRQVTIVANDEVIEDKECEWPEIPVIVNRNVAIPFSTYGQGEPKRMEGLQMAINRILSAFVTHHAYNAYPPELIPDSVVEMMDEQYREARTKPGQRIVIPQDILIQLGDMKKVVMNMETGTMTSDFWRLLDLLVQYIDMEGNQADVMQGDAASGWSGKTVQSLQGAANQVIKGKAIFTEFYLRNMAELIVYGMINRLTTDDWKKLVGRFPVQAIEAMQGRLKRLYIDISVEISSGSGASRMDKTNLLMQARQLGIPVSIPTIMEGLSLDPEAQLQEQADWDKKVAAVVGPVPAPGEAPGGAGGPPGGPPSQNGNKPQPANRQARSQGDPNGNGGGYPSPSNSNSGRGQ